jgi:hypothetical protein
VVDFVGNLSLWVENLEGEKEERKRERAVVIEKLEGDDKELKKVHLAFELVHKVT